MSQWPALATLYTEVLQCVTVCYSVLQCVPTTQGRKRRLEHFTVPCPHKFHLRGSSLLSDFLPFYNLSFASFENLVSSQFLAHPYFSPPTALILISSNWYWPHKVSSASQPSWWKVIRKVKVWARHLLSTGWGEGGMSNHCYYHRTHSSISFSAFQ